jgi:DNA-binding beta-propeller fold protein YncE
MIVGSGEFQYKVVEDWGRGPTGRDDFGEAITLAVDSRDRVYVLSRSPQPRVFCFDRDGNLLTSWGEHVFVVVGGVHGIWISDDDQVYCTDALNHAVYHLTTEGELLRTLGTPGEPGPPGMPFNMPTKAVLSQSGEIFVSDGYGQERVHRFSPDGDLLQSWGSKGTGPGQFDTPHGVRVDRRGRVLVADRANNRVQIFDADGVFLDEWTGLKWPNDIHIDEDDHVYIAEAYNGISIFSLDGKLLARWGEKGTAPGQFTDMPHGVCVDSRGDLYVAEVETPNLLQKFERV